MNLNKVAAIPIIEDAGMACIIFMSKNTIIIGILIPAPDIPPAFDNATITNINTSPIDSNNGCSKGYFYAPIYYLVLFNNSNYSKMSVF